MDTQLAMKIEPEWVETFRSHYNEIEPGGGDKVAKLIQNAWSDNLEVFLLEDGDLLFSEPGAMEQYRVASA